MSSDKHAGEDWNELIDKMPIDGVKDKEPEPQEKVYVHLTSNIHWSCSQCFHLNQYASSTHAKPSYVTCYACGFTFSVMEEEE
jgi:hypothetical protein